MDIIKRLDTPHKRVDAVIDTDAFNEVDDQFAISYLLRSADRINTVALYAAPFSFPHINTERGMEESFRETFDLQRAIAPLGPPVPVQPPLLGREVSPPGYRLWPWTWGSSSWPPPLA